MTSVQFYFLFPSLFMLHELEEIVWMPSFVKKISIQYPNNRILSYYTPFAFNFIVLEQFLILMTSLYLSYQFNNYSIYASIIIAYIYHVFEVRVRESWMGLDEFVGYHWVDIVF